MASDRMDTKAWRDLNAQLNRIALAAERMADAMEKYVENDPLAAVTKALEAETNRDGTRLCRNCDAHLNPDQTICPACGLDQSSSRITTYEPSPTYGSDLPESERWRLGS